MTMKTTRFVSVALTSILVLLVALYGSGGLVRNYIDLLSIMVMLLVPLILMHSSWTLPAVGRVVALALGRQGSRAELQQAKLCLASWRAFSLLTAALCFLLGFVAMFRNLSDRNLLGRNLAISLLCLFYALLSWLLVFMPMEVSLNKRLLEQD